MAWQVVPGVPTPPNSQPLRTRRLRLGPLDTATEVDDTRPVHGHSLGALQPPLQGCRVSANGGFERLLRRLGEVDFGLVVWLAD
jgi:hypothetical protein